MLTYFTGFFGIVFESDRETGYSIQRLWQAIAFSVLFVCSLFFNTLWLLLAIFIVTMPMFLIAEWEYSDEMKNSFSKCSRYNKSRCVVLIFLNVAVCKYINNTSLYYTGQTKYSLLTSNNEEVQDEDLQDVTAL